MKLRNFPKAIDQLNNFAIDLNRGTTVSVTDSIFYIAIQGKVFIDMSEVPLTPAAMLLAARIISMTFGVKKLDISGNSLGSLGPSFINALIPSASLESINISDNNLGEDLLAVIKNLKKLNKLSELDISDNHLGAFTLDVMNNLVLLPALYNLNASINNIGQLAPKAAEILTTAPILHILNLRYNNLEEDSPASNTTKTIFNIHNSQCVLIKLINHLIMDDFSFTTPIIDIINAYVDRSIDFEL